MVALTDVGERIQLPLPAPRPQTTRGPTPQTQVNMLSGSVIKGLEIRS